MKKQSHTLSDRRQFLAQCGAATAVVGGLAACRDLNVGANAQQNSTNAKRVIPGNVRVRKSIDALTPDEIAVYAKAIDIMRKLPASNPHSLAAQAKIHADSCLHQTWHFLPWHRPYLAYFEEVIRKVSNNENFALPYWDWVVTPRIPSAFADPKSPLYDTTRDPTAELSNRGRKRVDELMQISLFNLFMGGVKDEAGHPELSPHGQVHVLVGGNMGELATAGLDPLFWLHHCNVDRLWESWMQKHSVRAHPDAAKDKAWQSERLAGFWGRDGKAAFATTADTIDTKNFAYSYDSLYQSPGGALKISSIEQLPANRILTAQRAQGRFDVALDPSTSQRIARLGTSDSLGLVGSGNASQGSSGGLLGNAPLNSVSLILEGRFSNLSRIDIKSASGAVLESLWVFAHHMSRINVALGNAGPSIITDKGLSVIVEVDGRPANCQVKLVVG